MRELALATSTSHAGLWALVLVAIMGLIVVVGGLLRDSDRAAKYGVYIVLCALLAGLYLLLSS